MKNIVSLILSLVFAYNLAGVYLVYKLMQMEAKEKAMEEIVANLPDDELEVFIFDMKELKNGKSKLLWEEEGKEFWFKDRLYDVARIKYLNGKAHIYCLNDTKEEDILKNFSDCVHKNSDQQKLTPLFGKIPNYFFQDFQHDFANLNGKPFFIFSTLTYQSITLKVLTPPPRLS